MNQIAKASDDSTPVVVVGADGSPGSREALQWAAAYAGKTGADVLLVTAWHYPVMYGTVPAPGVDFETDAQKLVEDVAKEASAQYPTLRFRTLVAPGRAADVLIHAAEDADLLVVGSRGHGAFTGMMIGSVSMHCVGHAPCPVVVVR